MSVDGYEPGEKSWVVRGYESNNDNYIGSDVNWYFDVSADIDTRLETVKGAFVDAGHIHGLMFIPAYDFLKDMTGQMSDTGQLRTPRVKDVLGNEITTTMVYNYGNPAFDCSDWEQGGERPESCVSMKSVERGNIPVDSLPDAGLNPPGVIPRNPEIAEQNFDQYNSIMQEIFNSDIVAGNPYDIYVVKGYSPELTDYMKSFYTPIGNNGTLLLINPEDDVFFTSHNWDAFTEYASTDNTPSNGDARYVNSSMMFVASTLGGFQNEATHWFAVREGLPCTYSIRDSTKDDCGPLPNQFSEKDIVYNIIAASFGPYANIQKTDFERSRSPSGALNEDGFTTTLPRD
jgi:hypothetical protein